MEVGSRAYVGVEVCAVGVENFFLLAADTASVLFSQVANSPGARDGRCPAVTQYHAPAGAKFIALGMSAEIVVIVENENARVFPCALAEEVSRCQSTNASADDYEVVALTSIYRLSKRIRAFAIPQAMRKCKCAVMISTHPLARWRIIMR